MAKRTSKKEKGITLVALIITIIVLIILVGVTIGQIAGSDGIIKRAQNSTAEYKQKSAEEKVTLLMHEYMIAIAENPNQTLDNFLTEKNVEHTTNSDGTTDITVDGKTIKVNKDLSIADDTNKGQTGSGSITYTENGETKPLTKETPVGTKIGTTANISGKDGEIGVNLDWYLFDVSDDGKTAYLVSTPTYWVPDTTKEVSGAWVPRLVDEPDKEIQVSYMPNATYTISHLVSTTTFDERNKEKTNGAKLQKLGGHIGSKTHAMSQAIRKLKNGTSGYSPSSVTYKPSSKTLNYFKSVNSDWAKSENGRSTQEFSKWNENEQAACYLADADIFAGIKDQVNKAEGNLKGKIQSLVGGASVEQWCKAYNKQSAASTSKITCAYQETNTPGYIYKVNGTVQNSGWYTNKNTILGNDIYGAAHKNGNTSSSNAFYNNSWWWLASPSAGSSRRVCLVHGYDSSLSYSNSYGYITRFSLFASVSL